MGPVPDTDDCGIYLVAEFVLAQLAGGPSLLARAGSQVHRARDSGAGGCPPGGWGWGPGSLAAGPWESEVCCLCSGVWG